MNEETRSSSSATSGINGERAAGGGFGIAESEPRMGGFTEYGDWQGAERQ